MGFRRLDEAARALDEAVRHGGAEAFNIVQSDERFAPLRNRLMPRPGNLLGMPPAAGTGSPLFR
jgi:hypothetical protein